MSLRNKKRGIGLAYHSIILAVAMIGVEIHEPWLVWIGILDLLSFRLIPVVRFIQSKLIPTTRCTHCNNSITLKGHWQCSCGYISQIPRHVFLLCPQCGNDFTFVTCDCGIGLLV